MLILTMI